MILFVLLGLVPTFSRVVFVSLISSHRSDVRCHIENLIRRFFYFSRF